MNIQQVEGAGLSYITVEPDDYDPEHNYPLIVLLHGFGANMHDLKGLAFEINRSDYLYAFPNAPLAFDLGFGQMGYAWTPLKAGIGEEESIKAEELIHGFLGEVVTHYGIDDGKVILGGFSQGGGMTYKYGLPRPDAVAGLACLSCYLPEPRVLIDKIPSQRIQPVFISHGIYDEIVPADSARETKEFLLELGYNLDYHEYPIGHAITAQVVDDLRSWIKRVI